ncbi:hypothetical protein [Nocardia sp. NPDC019304]|uniref:hypothetical protein n=1 Tax=unclassified Nocardia TaxID=2637762 RepID=UPI0033F903A5
MLRGRPGKWGCQGIWFVDSRGSKPSGSPERPQVEPRTGVTHVIKIPSSDHVEPAQARLGRSSRGSRVAGTPPRIVATAHDASSADEHVLFWLAATEFFVPKVESGWRRVDLVAPSGGAARSALPVRTHYSVVFEATFDSRLRYDPVVEARAIRGQLDRPPDVAVAVVAPTLEVSVATQHAIAYETGLELGATDIRVVTLSERRSKLSDRKLRKLESPEAGRGTAEPATMAIERALEIVAGRADGERVDRTAAAFVYAYVSRRPRRSPFRCTPLQRSILQVVAAGSIVPTTAAIAGAVYSTEKKVSESIAELVAQLVPPTADGDRARDGHQRLYWLMHRYGAWIRLVDGRS